MYYFIIEATPNPGSEHACTATNAIVGCWIDFKDQEGAERLARFYIEADDWTPGKTDEIRWVERKDYEKDDESLTFYKEAEETGKSIVFFCYPASDETEDDDEAAGENKDANVRV